MPKLVMVSVPRAFSHMTDYTITGVRASRLSHE